MPRAEAVQLEIFIAAEEEAAKVTDSLAKHVDKRWPRNGGAAIEEILTTTGLVDACYLINLAKFGGVLPAWQDVPEVAWIGYEQAWRLKCWSGFGSCSILAVSAPCLDEKHPDKHGNTLRRVLPVLEAMLETARGFAGHEHATVGVMWYFMCVPRPPVVDQTEFEFILREYARCMAHSSVHVLLVTDLPKGGSYRNLRPYSDRAHCLFDECLSSLIKGDDCLWDLSRWTSPAFIHISDCELLTTSLSPSPQPDTCLAFRRMDASGVNDLSYAIMHKQMAHHRVPPMSPSDFTTAMQKGRHSFEGGVTADSLAKVYSEVFAETFDGTHTLNALPSSGFAIRGMARARYGRLFARPQATCKLIRVEISS